MATTQNSLNQDQDEFNAAFAEDAPQAQEPSEDEAFGLNIEAADPQAVEGEESAEVVTPAAIVAVDGEGLEGAIEGAEAKESADEATESANTDGNSSKEEQRLRSWEGRLKAMEAKLKEAGAKTDDEQSEVVAESIEKAAENADTPADEEKVEQIAEQVESGELTSAQAMKQLAEDFGEDFVRMIEVIATSKAKEAGASAASEKFGEVNKTVEDIINDIVDTKAKTHFERIADKHPDFNDIANSPEFASWIESMPEGEQEEAKRVATSGSAKEINGLLDGYKAAAKQDNTKEVDLGAQDAAMDAAEGVRSTGMRLPQQPGAADDDYLGAWDQY